MGIGLMTYFGEIDIIGALLVGMLVPYDDPRLVSGTGNANSSPWVIAIRNGM